MQYTTVLKINLPRNKVISYFDSIENMYKWQPGLKSHEFLDGTPGEEGSRTRFIYESRRGELIMTETIIKRALPGEFHASYLARGVHNEMYNYFYEAGENQTGWKSVTVFRFKGIMAIMALFMKSAFKKQTLMSMEQFKLFCEQQTGKE